MRTKIGTFKYLKLRLIISSIMYALLILAWICSLKDNLWSKCMPRCTILFHLLSGIPWLLSSCTDSVTITTLQTTIIHGVVYLVALFNCKTHMSRWFQNYTELMLHGSARAHLCHHCL